MANAAREAIDVMSVESVAEVLGVSARRVRTFCRDGRLGQRVGRRTYVITRKECLEFKAVPREVGNPNFKTGHKRPKPVK